jgi:hypothetical protein
MYDDGIEILLLLCPILYHLPRYWFSDLAVQFARDVVSHPTINTLHAQPGNVMLK